MSALTDLRRLLSADSGAADSSGVVLSVGEYGVVMVRATRRTVACTSLIPVAVGDSVTLQGAIIVSRQLTSTRALPEFRV